VDETKPRIIFTYSALYLLHTSTDAACIKQYISTKAYSEHKQDQPRHKKRRLLAEAAFFFKRGSAGT
jgi:hypothetical protein